MSNSNGPGSQADRDNHADQMNPNNDAYWDSRDFDGRPDDWYDRVHDDGPDWEPQWMPEDN